MLNFKTINGLFVCILAILVVLDYFINISFYVYVIGFFAWFFATAFGSYFIQWNYFLKAKHHNPKFETHSVAITFDDGPHPEFTPKVLQLLKQYKAKATFFIIGKNADSYPELVLEIIKEGHTIGNHTYEHNTNFGFMSSEMVVADLTRANSALKKITGLNIQLYRPAFGITNPKIAKAVMTLQLKVIGWNTRSYDTTRLSEGKVYKRITRNLKKGDVILLHDTSAKSIAVLERLLLFLQSQSMASITVDDMFTIEPYA